jgi:MFS family permease
MAINFTEQVSNANVSRFLEEEKNVLRMTNLIWTFINFLFPLGAFLGSFFSKHVLELLGRKKGFLFHNLFSTIGSIFVLGAPFLNSPVCVMVSRLLFGIQAGKKYI